MDIQNDGPCKKYLQLQRLLFLGIDIKFQGGMYIQQFRDSFPSEKTLGESNSRIKSTCCLLCFSISTSLGFQSSPKMYVSWLVVCLLGWLLNCFVFV